MAPDHWSLLAGGFLLKLLSLSGYVWFLLSRHDQTTRPGRFFHSLKSRDGVRSLFPVFWKTEENPKIYLCTSINVVMQVPGGVPINHLSTTNSAKEEGHPPYLQSYPMADKDPLEKPQNAIPLQWITIWMPIKAIVDPWWSDAMVAIWWNWNANEDNNNCLIKTRMFHICAPWSRRRS